MKIIHDTAFDPIAFEIKHQADFERVDSDEPIDNLSDDFHAGKWDGLLGETPEIYQWLSADYRSGYLAGVEEKFNQMFAE